MRARLPLLRAFLPLVVASAFALLPSCHLDSGSAIVGFDAYGAGPTDATGELSFTSPEGFGVVLSRARMHIGAVYLTTSVNGGNSANTACVEPGRYVGEVPGGVDLDLLSATPQQFSYTGVGTADVVETAELWLVAGVANAGGDNDINSETISTVIVDVAGTAYRSGVTYPFTGQVTIGDNRAKAVSDPSQPGLNPICKRRIITVSPPPFRVEGNQDLVVRIDPRGWFNSVDFSALDPDPLHPGVYVIPDSDSSGTTGEAAGRNFFTGILTGVLPSGASTYGFAFVPSVTSPSSASSTTP